MKTYSFYLPLACVTATISCKYLSQTQATLPMKANGSFAKQSSTKKSGGLNSKEKFFEHTVREADQHFLDGKVGLAFNKYRSVAFDSNAFNREIAMRKLSTCYEIQNDYENAKLYLLKVLSSANNSMAGDREHWLKFLYFGYVTNDSNARDIALGALSRLSATKDRISPQAFVPSMETATKRSIELASALRTGSKDPKLCKYIVEKAGGTVKMTEKDQISYARSIETIDRSQSLEILKSVSNSKDKWTKIIAEREYSIILNKPKLRELWKQQHAGLSQSEKTPLDTSGFQVDGYWPTGMALPKYSPTTP